VLNSHTSPKSLIAAVPSPTPYILLFLAVLIIGTVLLVKFPSLRKYRVKRNILVYFLVTAALVFSLFQAYEVSMGRTVYSYYIMDRSFPNYYPGTTQFNLTCQYLENRPASFYLIINGVNVSFPVTQQETYVAVNSTAIKVLFTVSENTPPKYIDTKSILFSIDENVTGFSFRVYPETMSDTLFPTGYTYGVDYGWNAIGGYYELSQPYIVVQP